MLGVWIDNIDFDEAIEKICQFIKNGKPALVVTPNVDHIVKLQRDHEFREIYKNASLIIPDGTPLLWAARLLGSSLKEKISGSDLFPRLCEVAAKKGYRLFFLGGRGNVAFEASEILKAKYPGLQIAGVYSPPYGFEHNEMENLKIVNMIKKSGADILFVGLGAPKQEKWISNNMSEYHVAVSIGIGASFEFAAGHIIRAPLWMQKAGLEWFWRFMMEPRRLWKRYFVEDLAFFWLILKQIRGYKFI